MCDHSEKKEYTYIDILNFGEIYMCECGALVDLQDSKNFGGISYTAMSPDELAHAIRLEIDDDLKCQADKVRKALGEEDHASR